MQQCKSCLCFVCKRYIVLVSDSISQVGYNFYWTGLKTKRQHGAGTAICNLVDIVLNNNLHQSERLMVADIVVCGCKIQMMSAYTPNKKACLKK